MRKKIIEKQSEMVRIGSGHRSLFCFSILLILCIGHQANRRLQEHQENESELLLSVG